jgi:hypothetical protein
MPTLHKDRLLGHFSFLTLRGGRGTLIMRSNRARHCSTKDLSGDGKMGPSNEGPEFALLY